MSPARAASLLLAGLVLQACNNSSGPVPFEEFAPPLVAAAPSREFNGRFALTGLDRVEIDILVDALDLFEHELPGIRDLPAFEIGFVQHGEHVIPLEAGPIDGDHNWWDWVFAPGVSWDVSGDTRYTHVAIPFALKETNEDCIHNGVMTFGFADDDITNVRFQVSAQTCPYLRFEMWGEFRAVFESGELPHSAAAIAGFERDMQTRLPARTIDRLRSDYPGTDPAAFGRRADEAVDDLSVYGFIIDGIHYQGSCETRRGRYPWCDEFALPSYSTAKSLVAGLAMMRAEFLFPGVAEALIEDYVPECSDGWQSVTIEHALDMATGRYTSPLLMADENAELGGDFFLGVTHADKVKKACGRHTRKEAPGRRWVYHTTDTYLAGAALNQWLKQNQDPDADLYRDLIAEPIWRPLGLGPSIDKTRRTDDDIAQPFSGYGLTFYRNDVAKLVRFLGVDEGRIDGEDILDRRHFDAVKGRRIDDPGLIADHDTMRYNNGFRIRDVSAEIGCGGPVWVTNLSGIGGINIILMPNATAYYRFSDGGVHDYMRAVVESHRIRPMCDD